ECAVILRFWIHALALPIITSILDFAISEEIIGRCIGSVKGFEYGQYMAPGITLCELSCAPRAGSFAYCSGRTPCMVCRQQSVCTGGVKYEARLAHRARNVNTGEHCVGNRRSWPAIRHSGCHPCQLK